MKKIIYQKYLKRTLNYIILMLICILLGIVIDSINPYLFGRIIDGIGNKDINFIKHNLFNLTIVLVVVQVLGLFEQLLGESIVLKTVNEIKKNLFETVLNIPYFKTQEYDKGELLNRIEFDASMVVHYYIDLVSSSLMIIGNLTISLYFLLNISKQLSFVAIILICIMYMINIAFKHQVSRIQDKIKSFSDQYYSWFQENITNLLGIKVFLQEEKTSEKYKELLDKYYKLQMKDIKTDTKIELGRGIVSIILNILVLHIATIYILGGKLTLGNLIAFNTYLNNLLVAISKLLEININKQAVNISYKRICSLLSTEKENQEKFNIDIIMKLEFKNVFFGYKENKVLKGISFCLDKPGIYSFVGANGCGKTTIFSLIEKLYFTEYGEIRIKNINISKIGTKCLRKNILYLTKTPFLVNDTIYENLRIGNKNISNEEIQNICKIVGLHDDIMRLENQYESIIDEAGNNFSSGQKQKLAFVRAYFNKASLILLDEVTSDMDGKSEKDICNLIKLMSQKSIVINITHRPCSLEMSNMIFFIEDGRIVDQGIHIELLERTSAYKNFFK